jgi:hypothetical protein
VGNALFGEHRLVGVANERLRSRGLGIIDDAHLDAPACPGEEELHAAPGGQGD